MRKGAPSSYMWPAVRLTDRAGPRRGQATQRSLPFEPQEVREPPGGRQADLLTLIRDPYPEPSP